LSDPAYRRAPTCALLVLAIMVGIVIGGVLVAHRFDRELAAERWQWIQGD
jgi:hypothetical protein